MTWCSVFLRLWLLSGIVVRTSRASKSVHRPLIAVVGPADVVNLAPGDLPCDIFTIGESAEELAGQEHLLEQATGLLWIPDVGGGVPSAPSEVLACAWSHLPNCKWVHSFVVGIDGLRPFIDTCLVDAEGVCMTNGKGIAFSSLAEYALASCLYFNKQLNRVKENTANGLWDNFEMKTLAGKTVGLLGFGNIGKATGRLAKAFGCRVIALRRQPRFVDDSGIADEVYGYADKAKFFQESDFVVCSLPKTPETVKFVGRTEIAAMKQSAVFISLGRGAVVDEEALAKALASKAIEGAALDVFVQEPLPRSSPFWGLDNVLITAHNADMTSDYLHRGWAVFRKNAEMFCREEPLITPVAFGRGY